MMRCMRNLMAGASAFALTVLTVAPSFGHAGHTSTRHRVVYNTNNTEFSLASSWYAIDGWNRPELPGYTAQTGDATFAIMQGANRNSILNSPFRPEYRFGAILMRAGNNDGIPGLTINNNLDLCTSNVEGDIVDIPIIVGQIDSSTAGNTAPYQDDAVQNSGDVCALDLIMNTGAGTYTMNGGTLDLSRYLQVSEGGTFNLVGDTATVSVGTNVRLTGNADGKPTLSYTLGANGINAIHSDTFASVNQGSCLDVDATALSCPQVGEEISLLTAANGISGSFSTTPVVGQIVRLSMNGCCIEIAEMEVYSGGLNVALGAAATQSSTLGGFVAGRAVDGNRTNFMHTDTVGGLATWEVDLGADYPIDEILHFARPNYEGTYSAYTLQVFDSTGAETFNSGSGQRILEGVHRYQFTPNVIGLGEQGTGWELVQGPNEIALRVLVSPTAPVADAGEDVMASCGAHVEQSAHGHVTLDASLTTDPQNDIVAYEWYYQGDKIGDGVNPELEFDHVGPSNTTVYTVDLVVTDSGGCQSTDSVEVSIYDNDAPDLVGVQADFVFECRFTGGGCQPVGGRGGRQNDKNVPFLVNASVRATDACDVKTGVTVTRTEPDGSSATATYYSDGFVDGTQEAIAAIERRVRCTGVTTYDYSTTDLSGNTVTASRTTTITDMVAPIITTPPNAEIECPWGNADLSPAALGEATANDRCNRNLTITYEDGPIVLNDCGLESFHRTWIASDSFNNTRQALQLISEVDNTDPVLSGLPTLAEGLESSDEQVPTTPLVVECDAVPSPATVTAFDHCDDANGLITEVELMEETTIGSCPNSSTIKRTWMAVDCSGNTVSASQIIEVQDTTKPYWTSTPWPSNASAVDINVTCESDVPAAADSLSQYEAADACGSVTVYVLSDRQVMDAGSGCPGSPIRIRNTYRAEDECGNTRNARVDYYVADDVAPSISAPDDATVECGGDTSPSATGTATANDGCGGAVTVGYSDSSVAGLGNTETITRTWTATDDCGNSSSDVQTITVEDTTNPSISVPDDATVECTDDTSPASTGSATGSDTCGSVSIGYSDSSVPGPGNTETITRTWTVTDESNNESSDVQTITVVDTTAPVLDGVPADATVECDAVPAVATVTALDSCDGALDVDFTENSTVGNCAAESVITRTWSAVDGSGNDSTASQVITVVDTTAPVLGAAPTDVTVECSADIPAMTSVGYTDNCGASGSVAGSDSASVDACGNGTITRTWDVSDECGNPAATVTQVITVIDTIAPVLMIPGDTAVPICGTTFDVTAGVSASDNCGGDLTSSVVVGGSVDTGAVGCYSVTYDVSDCTGNPAAQQSRDVLVPYNIEGLLQPLNDQTVSVVASSAASGEALNLDCSGLKNIKAKRGGLPLKIRLTDCNGNTVTDALLGGAEPKVTSILTLGGPDGNEIVDLVNPESTGNSNLPDGTMRISDDKWIYTLDVDDTGSSGLSAGCYAAEFTITLPGGCAVYAYAAFKLK